MQLLVFGAFSTFCFVYNKKVLFKALLGKNISQNRFDSQICVQFYNILSITVHVFHVVLFLPLKSSYWPWLIKYPSSPKHWCKKWFIRTMSHADTHSSHFYSPSKPTNIFFQLVAYFSNMRHRNCVHVKMRIS